VPHFQVTTAVSSRDVHAIRARCDGCDAPRPHEEHTCEAALWVVTEGAFELRDRRGVRVLDPTCAIVLAPGEPFTIRHPAGPDVCIALRGPIVDELAARDTREIALTAEAHAELVAAVSACRRGQGDALAVAEAAAALAPAPPHRDRALAAALARQLQLAFADSTSLDELTAAAGASLFHACRVFRRETGHTLHGYRRELRLRHALAMLIDGDAPLAAVAAQAGFASQSHLTNLFRARFGCTPGRVRARRQL